MKALFLAAIATTAIALSAPATFAGNTSSNASSNTSSDSGSHGSSYRHSHTSSVDSDDGRRRRVTRGSTYIDRFTPGVDRYRTWRFRVDRDDD